MDHLAVTKAYYARWLGCVGCFDTPGAGAFAAASPECDRIQPGYSQPIDVRVILRGGRAFVAYGRQAAVWAECLAALPGAPSKAAARLAGICGVAPIHSRKYVYVGPTPAPREARVLTSEDESAFIAFFIACNPSLEDGDWLPDYFADFVCNGLSCGVFRDGRLASCVDASEMPYMADSVREIGINTLPELRGRGLATDACSLTVRRILDAGLTPLWSTAAENVASQRLAERLGFRLFGDCLAVTLPAEGGPLP